MSLIRFIGLLVLIGVFASLPEPMHAQPSDAGICIDPDMEFPVACDEDDE